MIYEASVSKFEDGDSIRITAKGVSDKVVSPEIIDSLTKYSVNQPILYRHVHPSSPGEGEILGTIVRAEKVQTDDEQYIEFEAEMLNYTESQRQAIELIKLRYEAGDPMGVSIGFQEFRRNGESLDARPFEYSLTHIPFCDDCGVSEVITMEKNEYETKLAELQSALDKAKNKNTELETKISTFESKTKTLEDKIMEKMTQKFEDEIKVLNTKLEESEAKAKKAILEARLAPIKVELFKLEGDEQLRDHLYPALSEEQLTERLEKIRKKRPPTIVTKTMEESRADASTEAIKAEKRAEVKKLLYEDPEIKSLLDGKTTGGRW